jgi:hypothetical protein
MSRAVGERLAITPEILQDLGHLSVQEAPRLVAEKVMTQPAA